MRVGTATKKPIDASHFDATEYCARPSFDRSIALVARPWLITMMGRGAGVSLS